MVVALLKYVLLFVRRIVGSSWRLLYAMAFNKQEEKICKPLVAFGVLTDVQYADADNRPAGYDPAKMRYYRQALDHVDCAFSHWQLEGNDVKFVLQCGDIIDGLNRENSGSLTALQNTLSRFEKHPTIPTFHTVGNHELYNFQRIELAKHFAQTVRKMQIPKDIFDFPRSSSSKDSLKHTNGDLTLYYKFCPVPGVKCISLDCFEISVIGYDELHPNYQEAAKILYEHHGHCDFDGWDCDGLLTGLERRFQQMNGAVSKEQLEWLDQELTDSDKTGEKVIVFGHVSLSPESSDWSCLLWNYSDVINIFHRHSCVVGYFSGHTHNSGYAIDSHGIHYIVLNGIVETAPDDKAFITVSLYADRMEITGHGREESRTLWIHSAGLEDADSDVSMDISSDVVVLPQQATSIKVKV